MKMGVSEPKWSKLEQRHSRQEAKHGKVHILAYSKRRTRRTGVRQTSGLSQ